MDGAHPAHQFFARRLAQRYEIYGRIMLVRAFGSTAGAAVEMRIAVGRYWFDRTNRRNHIIVDVAKRLNDVRPFSEGWDFERCPAAALPRRCGAQELPGRNDARHAILREIVVEALHTRCVPKARAVPIAIAKLVLADRDVGGRRVPHCRLGSGHDRSDLGSCRAGRNQQ